MSFRKRRFSTRRRFGWKRKRGFNPFGSRGLTRVYRLKSTMLPAYDIVSTIPTSRAIGYYWNLSSLPDYTSLQSDWQEWKIQKVIFNVRPVYAKNDVSLIPSNSDQPFPVLTPLMVVNMKDSQLYDNMVSTMNNKVLDDGVDHGFYMRNAAFVKKFDGNQRFRWSCKPKVMFQTYETSTKTGYVPKRSWISVQDVETQHYGTVFASDPYTTYYDGGYFKTTENKQWWEISQTIVLKLRKQREVLAP